MKLKIIVNKIVSIILLYSKIYACRLLLAFCIVLKPVAVFSENRLPNAMPSSHMAENSALINSDKKIENKFQIYLLPDPCNKKKPYRANSRYKKLLLTYVGEFSEYEGYDYIFPFKKQTYKKNILQMAEQALLALNEETGFSYKIVERYQDANVFILNGPFPDNVLEDDHLFLSFPKGEPVEMFKEYLDSYGMYLKVAGIIIPDVAGLQRISGKLEKLFNDLIAQNLLASSVTPETFINILFQYYCLHAYGHVLGIQHGYLIGSIHGSVSNRLIKVIDKKQYDDQPPLMLETIKDFLTRFKEWHRRPLASVKEIAFSQQEIDIINNDNAIQNTNQFSKGNVADKPQCDDFHITFDLD